MARSMLGAPKVPKVQLRENLRYLLSLVRIEADGKALTYPASWDDAHAGSIRYRLEPVRSRREIIPGTGKQVALDLALGRLTDEPPMASTIQEAVDRLYEGHMEVCL